MNDFLLASAFACFLPVVLEVGQCLIQGYRVFYVRNMVCFHWHCRVMWHLPCLTDVRIEQYAEVVDLPVAFYPRCERSDPRVILVIDRHFDELFNWVGHRAAGNGLIPVFAQIIDRSRQGDGIADGSDVVIVDRDELVCSSKIGVPCIVVRFYPEEIPRVLFVPAVPGLVNPAN